MPQRYTGQDVFNAALERLIPLYEEGHTLVVSFSGGKDSGVCLELCIMAATMTNRLPVHVVMRDEEIMFPGTFEYSERVYARPEVNMVWLVANQPIINIFNRQQPYWWVFDPLLPPEKWVRQPPPYTTYVPEKHIEGMVTRDRFPTAPGKDLYAVIGLRAKESIRRRKGIASSKGYLTKPNRFNVRNCRPIYDWDDGDIWRAIQQYKWDYNSAYDVMYRLGVPRSKLRIAPPTMAAAALEVLPLAAKAWPKWFEQTSNRLEGLRSAAMFGRRAVEPHRQLGETWEECYTRECLTTAPDWITPRAETVAKVMVAQHSRHATTPFPQVEVCERCGLIGSWRALTRVMYMGDPFSQKQDIVPYCEPEQFRDGAGTWGGKPSF